MARWPDDLTDTVQRSGRLEAIALLCSAHLLTATFLHALGDLLVLLMYFEIYPRISFAPAMSHLSGLAEADRTIGET